MSHTEQDFARADFARHPDGRKAMRREGVRTDEPWYFLVGNKTYRKGDAQMAREGWEPVKTEDVKPMTPLRFDTPADLAVFATDHGLRHDWHEPDNQGINARIIGTHLDNAMGSSTRFEGESHCEFNVVLTRRLEGFDGPIEEDLVVVNLATLLAWAAEHGKCQR